MSQPDHSPNRRRRALLLLGLALTLLAAALRLADPAPVRDLRLAFFDQMQRLAPRVPADLPVRVVDIDEAALAEIGQWPWPRSEYARLLDRLSELGAAVVAFDLLLAEPDRYSPVNLARDPSLAGAFRAEAEIAAFDNDALLARSMQGRAVVLGVAARLGSGTQQPLPPKAGLVEIGEAPASGLFAMPATTPLAPPLGDVAAGIGGINITPGQGSGIIRQVPMIWQGPDGPLPGLAVEALRLALGETTYLLDGVPGVTGAVQSLSIGSFRVPTDPNGQIWLRPRLDDPALYVSVRDLLRPTDTTDMASLRSALEGHIVFVGTSAAGLLDIRTTPLGQSVPGVSIHAQLVEQILTGDMLYRSDFLSGLEVLALLLLGFTVSFVITRTNAGLTLLAGGAAGALVLGGAWVAFRQYGILFDATFPLVGGAVNFALLVGLEFLVLDRDKRRIRRSFAQYVAPELLGQIENSGHRLELGGTTREVTVLFSDIRNFTPLSASLPPQDLVALLNALFTAQGQAILERKGTIDKFIGDSIMAFWNAPLDVPDHARLAARTALDMRARLKTFNAGPQMRNRTPLAMAVGLATGEACVGNIGSAQRFNYTVIGDCVNEAARIEAACRRLDYDIAVSEPVARAIGDTLALLPAGNPDLKGIAERPELYIVVGDGHMARSPAFVALSQAHKSLLETLRRGDVPTAVTLARCEAQGVALDPGLARFYAALVHRQEDFRS